VPEGWLRVISDGGAEAPLDVPPAAADEGGPLRLWRAAVLALTGPQCPADHAAMHTDQDHTLSPC